MPPPTTTTSKVPAASAAGLRVMHHSGVKAVRQRGGEPRAKVRRTVSCGPAHPELNEVLKTVEARATLPREDRGRGDHQHHCGTSPAGARWPKCTRPQAR